MQKFRNKHGLVYIVEIIGSDFFKSIDTNRKLFLHGTHSFRHPESDRESHILNYLTELPDNRLFGNNPYPVFHMIHLFQHFFFCVKG